MNTFKPSVSEKTRTVVYFVLLAGAAVSLAAQGLAPVWAPDLLADKIASSAQVLTSVLAVIGGGLGVAYRPTLPGSQNAAQYGQRAAQHVRKDEK